MILDNYVIHTSHAVEKHLKLLGGRVQLHFLPPYCPDHNRIEREWQDLHANVTRNHRCETMLELRIRCTDPISRSGRERRIVAAWIPSAREIRQQWADQFGGG